MSEKESTKGIWAQVQELWQKALQTAANTQAINSKLDEMGLSAEKIGSQNPPQLVLTLGKIDSLIDKGVTPQELGSVEFSHFKAIALSRKQLVMSRLSFLTQQKNIDRLEDLAKKVTGKDDRAELEKTIEEMKKELQDSQTQLKQNAEQLRQLETERLSEQGELNKIQKLAEVEITKIEKTAQITERRYRIVKSFLERESVATIIGAILLFGLAIVLVWAAFKHVALPEIINNAFLLILGYYFGRENVRDNSSEKKNDAA